ncbi:MAG: chitobiase/beta-hexosaminidase C-terminal domain-containing protein, partial [Polyangiales bacterium]
MNKSFGLRFLLAAMMALAVAVTGCTDDDGGPAGSGGSGVGGSGGGMGGSGGMAALSVSADPTTTTFGTLGAITTATIDVTLAATGEGSDTAVIYYTTDATEVEVPDGAGGAGGGGGMAASTTMEYTAPITIDANTVLKFLAVVDGGATTEQQVEGYTLTPDDETAQWAASGHGMILDEPWRHWDESGAIGAIPREIACAKCHSAEGFLEYAATEANVNPAALPLGLDCSACHSGNPTTWSDLATYPALENVLFPSGARQNLMGNSNMCITCHQGR